MYKRQHDDERGGNASSDIDGQAPVRRRTLSGGGGMLQDLPDPHVPNAAEMELLAIARKSYLTLRVQKRIRRVNGVWNTRYAQRPLGAVPDFSVEHAAALEQRLYTRVAAIQEGVTVPQEFMFQRAPKATAAARVQLQEQRKQRISKALQRRSGRAHVPHGTVDDGRRVRFLLCFITPVWNFTGKLT